ncbi:MAG: hypothetical protein R2880_02135 [Deinococcales bacterium]
MKEDVSLPSKGRRYLGYLGMMLWVLFLLLISCQQQPQPKVDPLEDEVTAIFDETALEGVISAGIHRKEILRGIEDEEAEINIEGGEACSQLKSR